MKKAILLSFVIMMIIFISGCEKKTDIIDTEKTSIGILEIQEINDDVQVVNRVQQNLADLIINHVNAKIATHLLLSIDPEKMPIEEYIALGEDVVRQRAVVENDAYMLGNILVSIKSKKYAFLKNILFTPVYAQGIVAGDDTFNATPFMMFSPDDVMLSNDMMNNFVLQPNAVYQDGGPSEVVIDQDKRGQVEALRGKVPEIGILSTVQLVFGTNAQKAQELIEEHYKAAADVYINQAKVYRIAEGTAQAIESTSKVTLFVGGAVLTAGGSTLLTAPVGGALLAGMGSTIGAGKATMITLGGVSTILGVGADSATIGIASTGTAATFTEMRDAYAPISIILSLIDLKDGLQNPGNLLTLFDRGKLGIEKGEEFVTMVVDGNNLLISNQNPNHVYMNQDGLLQRVPDHILSALVHPDELQKAQKEKEALDKKTQEPKDFGNVGVYKGKTTIAFDFQGKQEMFAIETQMLISTDGEVKVTFDDKTKLHYALQGMSLEFDYIFKGTALGQVQLDGNNLSAQGEFTSSAKMTSSAGVHIPPEYASQMQAGGIGNIHIVGYINQRVFEGKGNFLGDGVSYESEMKLLIQ